MSTTRTNWLAVAVAALSGVALGWLWYGMLFVRQWAEGNGLTLNMEAHTMTRNGVEIKPDASPMVCNFVAMLIYAYVLNWLVQRANMRSWAGGAQIGFTVGLVSLVGIFVSNMFAQRPMGLSWVDGPYVLILLTLIGSIVGGWQKKG